VKSRYASTGQQQWIIENEAKWDEWHNGICCVGTQGLVDKVCII